MKKILFCFFLFFIFTYAIGGTISLQWDPVSDSDLQGYKIHYGTSSGNYNQVRDAGNVTTYTLQGLSECTRYYLVVTAYNSAGTESDYSNEVNGLPKPQISSLSPSSAEQGRSLTITISGTNYENGDSVRTSNPGITILSTTYISCTQLQSQFSISETAATGLFDVDVVNPGGVYGRAVQAFQVTPSIPPTVSSTSPADGATNVPLDIHPQATFSEAIAQTSVSSLTILLLDKNSNAVPQASGSPSLNSAGTIATITPQSNLSYNSTYRIKVVGGANGVKDLAGHPMNSDYIQNTGFTTVADTTPPVISNVASSNITATSADITWTTDEPSDSMVEYKASGSSSYRQTTVDPQMVTSHSVHLSGLDPSTTYYYHAVSKDANSNSATSSPDQAFTTSSSPYSYIAIETEEGEPVPPMQTGTGGNPPAFSDKYIYSPEGSGSNLTGDPTGKGNYDFYIPASGTYTLWIRIYAIDSLHSSFWVKMSSGTSSSITASQYGSWEWVQGLSYSLDTGINHLELGQRDEQAEADRILLTDDAAFVPSESPGADRTAPASVSSFTASAGDGKNTLSWTNPSDADFKKTIIRYRTDGIYPKHPEDGMPVCTRPGSPSAGDSYTHSGLTNGSTYYYSAFAIDGDKNASNESMTAGTPQANIPPGQVRNNRRRDKKH